MLQTAVKLKIIAISMLIAASLAYAVYSSDWFQKKYLYPFPYQGIVYKYSLEYNIDPFLVAGVIRAESKFIPQARSPRGALGLMQIMPDTAKWIAAQTDQNDFSMEQLTDPEINIRFGTWYLSSLQEEFGNNEILILAAYNGGRGNVQQWMQQNAWPENFDQIERIPFEETREYVTRVLHNKRRYQELYGR